jgi:DNA-directed RNA polymerase specialized sigma24 family protein
VKNRTRVSVAFGAASVTVAVASVTPLLPSAIVTSLIETVGVGPCPVAPSPASAARGASGSTIRTALALYKWNAVSRRRVCTVMVPFAIQIGHDPPGPRPAGSLPVSDLLRQLPRSGECYAGRVSWRTRVDGPTGPPTDPVSDERLRQWLAEDPERGWRTFIDAYTPAMLALIERAGIVDRDEAMEVYVRACERLAANHYAALRRRDPAIGSLMGWLAVVVKRAAVDWVRSRAGRRRIFAAVRELDRFHQRLFEMSYWEGRRPAEAAELLGVEWRRPVGLDEVFDALERIDGTLSSRHRSELLSMVARTRAAVPLEGDGEAPSVDPPADTLDPESQLRARERDAQLERALAALPAEDAAIVSLKFVEGLTRPQIQRFLRLTELTEHRVRTIVATLRAKLAAAERGEGQIRQGMQAIPTASGGHDG